MSPENRPVETHITVATPLLPAIGAWEIYLQDQDRSLYTVKAFIGDITLFASSLPPDHPIGSLTTHEINHFLHWLQHGRNVPCSPKSLARRITSIKSFCRWLVKGGIIHVDPAEKVLQQSVISPLPEVLTQDEQAVLQEVLTNYRTNRKADARPYALVNLLLTTAIKKGECLAININHIDLQAAEGPQLFIRYPNPSSRYKERKINLSEDWVSAYQEYTAQYKPTAQVFPWSPRRLEYLLEDMGREAGLTKHLSFDMCRWTCAVNDWQSDMEREKIRQKLGISKIQWREISMKLRQLSGEQIP